MTGIKRASLRGAAFHLVALLAFGCGGSRTGTTTEDAEQEHAGDDAGAVDGSGGVDVGDGGGADRLDGPGAGDVSATAVDARDGAVVTTDGPVTDGAVDGASDVASDVAQADAVSDTAQTDVPGSGTALEYCTGIPALASSPVIDGTLEPGLSLLPIDPLGWNDAKGPIPAGHKAEMAVAWRSDSLYLYIKVTDDTRVPARSTEEPYCGDSVEVYLDDDGLFAVPGGYDSPGTRQLVAAAPGPDGQPVSRGSLCRHEFGKPCPAWTSTEFKTFAIPTGFVFEARLTTADLERQSWSLAANGKVGFDISINVSFPQEQPAAPGKWWECPNRLGQYFLRLLPGPLQADAGTDSDKPWSNSSAFCTPRLLAP